MPLSTTIRSFALSLLAATVACSGASTDEAQTTAPKTAAAPATTPKAAVDSKAGDGKADDGKSSDAKAADGKVVDSKAADGKAADGKAAAPSKPPAIKPPIEGGFELTPADAKARGLPRVGIRLDHDKPALFLSPLEQPGVFATFSGAPGGDLGLRIAWVPTLDLTAEAITDYAKTHDEGKDVVVQEAVKVRIAGMDRWVAVTLTKTHRGSLGTAWVFYPGVSPGTGVMVRAWIEVDPTTTNATSLTEHFKGALESLALTFEVEATYEEPEDHKKFHGVLAIGSDGHVSIVSVKGGDEVREEFEYVVKSMEEREDMLFKAPPPAGSPRYTLAARVYQRTDADFMEGLVRKLQEYDVTWGT